MMPVSWEQRFWHVTPACKERCRVVSWSQLNLLREMVYKNIFAGIIAEHYGDIRKIMRLVCIICFGFSYL